MCKKCTSSSRWKNIPSGFIVSRKFGKTELSSIITKPTTYYNLDVILAVGYRVKSNRGILFQKWTLKTIDNIKTKKAYTTPLIVFEHNGISLDVNVSPNEGTVWLTKDQINILYDTTRQNIEYHINNIYEENELESRATCKEILQVQNEKNRKVTRTVNMYNLDMIISLGCRINNIFKEELDEISNSQKMRLTGNGKPTIYYSLNVIISVGYRVKSTRGVRFRQCANQVSKRYLLNGYSINKERCLVCHNSVLQIENKLNEIGKKDL